ncbi:hypothetical protein Cadr_000017452 [Camelus dromedarius]|uniref:Uncharacterized protein n=1 Tax=Camelus dromedarius TaxID=9838 RepID=A0A5N4DF96_CAMDR|nr:hypothetical protein Cadr_000017452 [Camelus dromedarius]
MKHLHPQPRLLVLCTHFLLKKGPAGLTRSAALMLTALVAVSVS